jgi:hypothetical protein
MLCPQFPFCLIPELSQGSGLLPSSPSLVTVREQFARQSNAAQELGLDWDPNNKNCNQHLWNNWGRWHVHQAQRGGGTLELTFRSTVNIGV